MHILEEQCEIQDFFVLRLIMFILKLKMYCISTALSSSNDFKA